jgi:hypothetical protein
MVEGELAVGVASERVAAGGTTQFAPIPNDAPTQTGPIRYRFT